MMLMELRRGPSILEDDIRAPIFAELSLYQLAQHLQREKRVKRSQLVVKTTHVSDKKMFTNKMCIQVRHHFNVPLAGLTEHSQSVVPVPSRQCHSTPIESDAPSRNLLVNVSFISNLASNSSFILIFVHVSAQWAFYNKL